MTSTLRPSATGRCGGAHRPGRPPRLLSLFQHRLPCAVHRLTFGGPAPPPIRRMSRWGEPATPLGWAFVPETRTDGERSNWTWHDGRRWAPDPGGPAVIFDIDGVLSDAAGRQHFLDAGTAGLDRLLRGVWRRPGDRGDRPAARTARSVPRRHPADRASRSVSSPRRWPGCSATGCAGTCSSCARGATTPRSPNSSRRWSHDLRAHGFDLRLAFEDDPSNHAMYVAAGVPCVYIHSGYYE